MGDFKLRILQEQKELPTEYEEKIRSEIDALYIKRDALIARKYKAIKECDARLKSGLAVPGSWTRALHEIQYQEKSITARIHALYERIK